MPLLNALKVVKHARDIISELESLLPASPNINFRERLVAHLEALEVSALTDFEFQAKAGELILFYEQVFGVNDLIDQPDE